MQWKSTIPEQEEIQEKHTTIKSNEFIHNKSVIILSFNAENMHLLCVYVLRVRSEERREWLVYGLSIMPHEPLNVNNGVFNAFQMMLMGYTCLALMGCMKPVTSVLIITAVSPFGTQPLYATQR